MGGNVRRFALLRSQRSLEADSAYRLVLSVDYCLSYTQTLHLEGFKGSIIMLSEGYNHIIAGVGDSLSVLLQAMFPKSHSW